MSNQQCEVRENLDGAMDSVDEPISSDSQRNRLESKNILHSNWEEMAQKAKLSPLCVSVSPLSLIYFLRATNQQNTNMNRK